MTKHGFNSRSLTFFAVLFVGALVGASFGAAVSVDAASTTVSYTVYKDSSGYTCAKNSATGAIDYRSTSSYQVIQKAVDRASGNTVRINAGTYDITNTILSSTTSITGVGNATILKATASLKSAVILVTNGYAKMDGTWVSSRPNDITISNLQVDGNRAVRTSGTMEGIGFINTINSHVLRVYVHDVIAGQGIYMSNSQYCTIEDSQIYNIGDSTWAHYGSGIAFGEASSTKVACSYITIDNVLISKASMSSIDLEPANHITITNCVFRDAAYWNGHATPVITMYQISGYAANDYITVTGNNMYGAFSEFIILAPSSHSVVSKNVITYTAGNTCAIYSTGSHENKIIGNIIKTVSREGIISVDCNLITIEGNIITDMTSSKTDYGVRFYASSGTSEYNVIKGNQLSGFKYAITANSRSDHTTVSYNTVKSSYVGILLSGSSNVKTGNVLNGAYDWKSY